MKKLLPILALDFYKLSHKEMMKESVTKMYETWTARGSRLDGVDSAVWFGLQSTIKSTLIDYFKEAFFDLELEDVINEYKRVLKYTLTIDNPETSHIEKLHKLGYLPIKIKALKEGLSVPVRVPMMTIENTHEDFAWLVGYLETIISCELWHKTTVATIAKQYRNIADEYAIKTVGSTDFVDFQIHGFEMRGMVGVNGAMNSGAGHLVFFKGSDTVPAYFFLEQYYNANIEKELLITSLPASEHTLQCTYADDYTYIKTMITEKIPKGLVSLVIDGYDYWNVMTSIIPSLKNEIEERDGKTIFRGDSGNIVDIICGTEKKFGSGITAEEKGSIEILWEIFGGTINSKGYKELNPKVGYIFGDGVTVERAKDILNRLELKGFASINIALGVGSYTYQYVTRDTLAHALKCTYAVIDGEETFIFKDPKTDDGTKKSQKGKVVVVLEDNKLKLIDGLNDEQEKAVVENQLVEVFKDGKLLVDYTIAEIRETARR
jgi:nicotinamide phosphoribosyltransferase